VTPRRLLEGLLLAVLIGLGTWFGGWWAAPIVAAIWQAFRRAEPSWLAGFASAVAWGGLLLRLPWLPLGRLTARLSGVLHLPPGGALLAALGYAWLLGWSTARLVRGLRPQ
jgi:hypothetical protein